MGRRRGLLATAGVCAWLLGATGAHAAPGDLDPEYGDHGVATLPNLGQPLAYFGAGGLDSAGRFVGLFGTGSSTSCLPSTGCVEHWQRGIARFSPSGEFDTGFGRRGTILFPFDQAGSGLFGLQSDDGMILDPDSRGLDRILPDGAVDWEAEAGESGALLVLPDDSLLTGGGSGQIRIQKWTAGGALDTDFGDGGTVTTQIGSSSWLTDLVPGDEGTIWAVGWTSNEEFNDNVAVVRYESDGSLDESFSADGIATFDLAPGDSSVGAQAAVDSSGRLIVSGWAGFDPQRGLPSFTMAIKPDGQIDRSYGDGGFILSQAPPFGVDFPTEMIPLDDNRILMLQNGVLWVADGNGRLDASFGGSDSMAWLPSFTPLGITTAAEGKILAYGSTPYREEAVVARFLLDSGPPDADADGVRDPSDECPNAYAATADGCQFVARTIDLRIKRRPSRLLAGTVSSADPAYAECPEQSVRIRRKFRGRTKVVATVPVSTPGRFEVPIENKRGQYYARLPEQVTGPTGHCAPIRSKAVRFWPLPGKEL
jgi:uncharacterized delta-60 repeat protein